MALCVEMKIWWLDTAMHHGSGSLSILNGGLRDVKQIEEVLLSDKNAGFVAPGSGVEVVDVEIRDARVETGQKVCTNKPSAAGDIGLYFLEGSSPWSLTG
jgi:hypothetical protein